jgi:hypothetical protein
LLSVPHFHHFEEDTMLQSKKLVRLFGAMISGLALVGTLLLFVGAAGAFGPNEIFTFAKTMSTTQVKTGDVITVTISVSATTHMTQTVPFTITDPFQNTALWTVITPTITTPAIGNAYYDSATHTVVWASGASGLPVGGSDQVKFQVRIVGLTNWKPTVVTNTAYITSNFFNSLPAGSLPGTLPTDPSAPAGARAAMASLILQQYRLALPIIKK